MSRSRAFAASPVVLLGAALAAVAFAAKGGTELGRTTVVEVLLLIAGGAVVAAAALYGRKGPLYGGGAVLGLAALAALTALSVTWSIAPESSFVEAGRALAYLAVLAGAVAAPRLWPRHSGTVVKGVLLGAVAVVAYALASRVWPGALAEDELTNRLSQPYGYWNAVGTTAALMVPPALWLGSRRTAGMVVSALAYPALGLAMLAILLTQSRGALAAALIGAALWFALVPPLRLRSLPVLVVPAIAVAPLAAWALSKDAFSRSQQPLSVKESVATEFGLLVLLLAAVLLAAGLAVGHARARRAPSLRLRRRVGIAAVAAVCAVPLVLFASVAFSDRGIGGTVSDRVDELTDEGAAQPREGAARFTASSSTRGRYWREAGKVFADRRAAGTGAGTFGVARLRYRKNELVSRHAHGWVPQTLADLGLVGLAVSLALLGAWLVAAARTTGLVPRVRRRGPPPPRRDWTPERAAVAALAFSALVFGLQSLIDWTWFVPAPAVMALVAAGFVAGRGPVGTLAGEGGIAAAAPPEPVRWAEVRGRRVPVPEPARLGLAAAVLLAVLLFAWAVWQPERSDRLSNQALEQVEERRISLAAEKARSAAEANPLSPRPLLVEASVRAAAGQTTAARRTLERAVLRYPNEPRTWLRLASFQLFDLDRPSAALETLKGLLYLDPKSKAGRQLFLDARVRERQQQAEQAARRG